MMKITDDYQEEMKLNIDESIKLEAFYKKLLKSTLNEFADFFVYTFKDLHPEMVPTISFAPDNTEYKYEINLKMNLIYETGPITTIDVVDLFWRSWGGLSMINHLFNTNHTRNNISELQVLVLDKMIESDFIKTCFIKLSKDISTINGIRSQIDEKRKEYFTRRSEIIEKYHQMMIDKMMDGELISLGGKNTITHRKKNYFCDAFQFIRNEYGNSGTIKLYQKGEVVGTLEQYRYNSLVNVASEIIYSVTK